MLTHTMTTNPEAARRLMTPLAWHCCAARTPAGRVYDAIVTHISESSMRPYPDSWGSACGIGTAVMSSKFARVGLVLARPLLSINGTGQALERGNVWHCGKGTMASIAIVDWLTQSLSRKPAQHILAAALIVGWTVREASRVAVLAIVLALGACGGLLGAGLGVARYDVNSKRTADFQAAIDDIDQYRAPLLDEDGDTHQSVLKSVVARAEYRLGRRLRDDETIKADEFVAKHLEESRRRDAEEWDAMTARRKARRDAEIAKANGRDEVFGW